MTPASRAPHPRGGASNRARRTLATVPSHDPVRMRPREAKVVIKVRWSAASLNYKIARTDEEMHAAAADGVRRWKIASWDLKNARTKEEQNAAEAAIRQIILDENSGKIPFVGIESTLPPLVPLPRDPGDVVATMIGQVPPKHPE
jgi:hypothetical protein